MTKQRTYKFHERHEYVPEVPCPYCGDDEPHVDWINVASHDDPDAWIPGLLTCTNPDCPGSPQ